MTDSAIRWESRLSVVRIGGSLIVLLVARIAGGGQSRVHATRVTALAAQRRVRAGQRKRGLVVIKLRPGPACCAVTHRAVGREPRLSMVGIRRALVVLYVTSGARSRRSRKPSIHVTLLAGHRLVRARQGELRKSIVVKRRGLPRRRVVASLASVGELSGNVIGILCALEVLCMARRASGRRACVLAIDVALLASHRLVSTRQRKLRLVMVERCWLPRCSGVADLACVRKITGYVIGVLRALEVLQVA